MSSNYPNHIAILQKRYEQALEQTNDLDGILIHSGVEQRYFADDQAPPFKAFGHFCNWLPINRPDQLLLIVPGRRPVYFQVIPQDYWYDQSIQSADWWTSEFDIVSMSTAEQVGSHLKGVERLAFLGEERSFARHIGVDRENINPSVLLQQLDFLRAYKSEYEIQQIRSANHLALIGHDAARESFLAGGSEYAVHMAYLQACQITEQDCPYTNIVAINNKAAILHYQHKRHCLSRNEKSQVLLIDAGCRVNNYCSDVTRTICAPHCHHIFKELLAGMARIQKQLVEEVQPGRSFIDLHRSAMRQVSTLAVELNLLSCSEDQSLVGNFSRLFMPHGVGHLLGIQVHDVGGLLADTHGSPKPPPADYPFLRNTRTMAENMVFTIEPGFYFVPQLLNPLRDTKDGKYLNWTLIDELIPLGGIRIEDNIRVTANGVENLTR